MAKTIDSSLTLPNVGDHGPGQIVESADWQDVAAAQHYHFARTGAVVPGMIFRPAWETTSTSYTTTNSSTTSPGEDYDLDDWQGLFQFQRLIYGNDTLSAAGWEIHLDAYCANLDVRVTMIRINGVSTNGSTTTYTVTASNSSGDAAWASGSREFTNANGRTSGNIANDRAWFLCYVEAKVPSTGTGYLHQFSLRETRVAGTELPRG